MILHNVKFLAYDTLNVIYLKAVWPGALIFFGFIAQEI